MYQFYYSKNTESNDIKINNNIKNEFEVKSVRPTLWEEHCLECAAPLCFNECPHYESRSDGRCKRFHDGISVFENNNACGIQVAHVSFKKWANMMTIIFPDMIEIEQYNLLIKKQNRLGEFLNSILRSHFPVNWKWWSVRLIEYARRRIFRSRYSDIKEPDAFIFHGYSSFKGAYNLIMEIYKGKDSVFKYAMKITEGENLIILSKNQLSNECWKPGNIVKIYPENNLEIEIDILWCDFVNGTFVTKDKSADKIKCVVWDLDNTLWDGILIETENTKNLKLREGVLELIKTLDERGIIQSIASKNDYENAWEILKLMKIEEYFLYPQIHWNAKSSSMLEISKKLNIGIDSLALIDDSIYERKQVQSAVSTIRCYSDQEIDKLLDYTEFEVPITDESKKRRLMYKTEEKRNNMQIDGNQDTITFLKQCNLKINVFTPVTSEEIKRCYELVVRTNQLNMSGKKYTFEEFKGIIDNSNYISFAFSGADNFGSYGTVGFGQYEIKGQVLEFKEFAMSCRVASKYVESSLLCSILKYNRCINGKFKVIKTKKNILLRTTFDEIGMKKCADSHDICEYVFDDSLNNQEIVGCTMDLESERNEKGTIFNP